MRGKYTALITLFLLVCLCTAFGLWLRTERRQYALNGALIAALWKNDDRQALALVKAGADPNTQFTPTPVPSLPKLVMQLFHHSLPPPINDSPTAFMIACGAEGVIVLADRVVIELKRPDNAPVVQAMLEHGANVNVTDANGWTPLDWALVFEAPAKTVDLLLEHGANVNASTPLTKRDRDVMHQLLTHGANPNLADKQGDTPFMWVYQNLMLNFPQPHNGIRLINLKDEARK